MDAALLLDLAVALGLGLLVGLQREWAEPEVAGIRTFALISLLGAVSALLARSFGGWILAAGLAGVAALLVVGDAARMRRAEEMDGEVDPGITTEVAALAMFGIGALVVVQRHALALVLGGTVAVLLQWKEPLHGLVRRIGEADLKAIMRLALLALVVLPLLPDRAYGPYSVLNPFQIWLMVVLIVGISLAAYAAYKLFGQRRGTLTAGFMGGLISSTATAVSYARRAARDPDRAPAAALVVFLSSTVVFARVLVEIAVVAPGELDVLAPPVVTMMAFMGCVAFVAYRQVRGRLAGEPEEREPPSDLRAAVTFGLLYAAVLFAVAAAREHLGPGGLYAVAGLSGLTDMDAITLSTTQLVRQGEITAATGWRLVLVGGMANLVFKAGAVAVLGTRRLALRVALLFAVALAGGGAILALWP